MNYDREFKIVFEHGGRVWLINIDQRRERFNIGNLGLNYDDHDQYIIDEEDIKFKIISSPRGSREKVESILIDGKWYRFSDRRQTHIAQSQKSKQKVKQKKKVGGSAPYNFIPLNELVSKSNNFSDHSIYAEDKLSGYIDYEINNLTDLFIRENGESPEFFGESLNRARIPGSSMRGLIRTLYEIITYSKIGDIDVRKRFFNRNVGRDTSRYKGRLNDSQRAGWVIRRGREYYLMEASKIEGKRNYVKVAVQSEASEYDQEFRDKLRERGDVYIKWNDLGIGKEQYTWDKVYAVVKEGVVKQISINMQNEYQPYVLFQTGHMTMKNFRTGEIKGKKHQYLIGTRPEKGEEEDITESINLNISDERRQNEYKLYKQLKEKENTWYPCFYIKESFEGKDQFLIGETPMFRLPYEREVIDFLPAEHKEEIEDIAIKVFGSTKMATKVYFEDALALGKVEYGAETGVKMLASPKPTSYAHYAENGMSYDDQAMIRGNKMYWHKKEANYQLDYTKKIQQYVPQIKPIKKATFSGRVRFDNLSKSELGALLFIFNLPEKMALKLGMGKPYGMGSVNIKNSTLHIIDRPTRYESLFDSEGNWSCAIDDEYDIDTLIGNFIKSVSAFDPQITSRDNLFESDRMRQLKAMLTYDHKRPDWLEKTRYMTLNEFKRNEILHTPENI